VPTLDGSLGILVARWTPVSNNDLVVYEVHLSTSSGFTPDSSTKVSETTGASFVFRKTASGAALSYGVPYYCKIVAKDPDGSAAASAQATSTLAQVSTPDIVANSITSNEIATGAITADEIAAGSVTAVKINVSSLSAVSANMGTLTAGSIYASYMTTRAFGGGESIYIVIDGSPGGGTKDRIQFISGGSQTALVATNGGIRLGSGSGDKLGFWGASPTTKASAITGDRSSETGNVINQLLNALQSYGLITNNTVA
jgi:hypothetical protein